ncbi:MAG: hypothetical protein DI610_06285 [Staphylococcus hominis]|nr:MAG: hypothetical protein DI610_06285 [Staphylococcus hominis]
MTHSFRAALAATVVVYSLTLSAQAHAQAFYLQEQSARAAGRAFSGEVADIRSVTFTVASSRSST